MIEKLVLIYGSLAAMSGLTKLGVVSTLLAARDEFTLY